jgi:hypothetical protein
LGFLLVASYLSRYGVSSFSVLQLQYLIVGFWVLGPPAVHVFIIFATRKFDAVAAPEITEGSIGVAIAAREKCNSFDSCRPWKMQ